MTADLEERLVERKKRRDTVKGLHPDSLSFKLATLAVGEVMLREVKRSAFNNLRDRVRLSCDTRVMAAAGADFECRLLHCRDLADPAKESFIMRIERLPNKLKGS